MANLVSGLRRDSEIELFRQVLAEAMEIAAEGEGSTVSEELGLLSKSASTNEEDDEMEAIDREIEATKLAVQALEVFTAQRRRGRW